MTCLGATPLIKGWSQLFRLLQNKWNYKFLWTTMKTAQSHKWPFVRQIYWISVNTLHKKLSNVKWFSMSLRHLVISLYVSSSSDCDYKVYYHNDEVWYQGSNRQYRCIVSDNSLVLTRRRAIIWTVSAQIVFPQERIMLPVPVFVFWACMLNDTICHMIHTTGNIYQPSYVTWVTRWITDITGYYSVLSGVSGR